MTPKDLASLSEHILGKRFALLSLWQEIADHFYPERANFTQERQLGTEFAEHLMTSLPVTIRRDLGNSFTSMLRPKDKDWFEIRVVDEDRETPDVKRWLEFAAGRMKRDMYARTSQFVRATKEGDHDFASFGQCVISVKFNLRLNSLVYQCWHLKDVAWMENDEGRIDTVVRAWNPTAKNLLDMFGERGLHSKVVKKAKSGSAKMYETVKCRHMVLPSELFNGKYRNPFVSVYLDLENMHIIEEVGINQNEYVIPRWQTVSGSQYAHSPATICALPDARLIQAMTLVLLEAGEKSTNPPLIATEEMIRSGIQTFAGGVTWVDAEYDEKMGEVLRPISQDYRGMPMGMEMHDRVAAQLMDALYINKIGMPRLEKEATAFEISQLVQDYIRQAMPLFEPMEQDYNGQICEASFNLEFSHGKFGPMDEVPKQILQGEDFEFRFQSPLHDNVERIKSNRFMEVKELLASAIEMDPTARFHVDIHQAFRDAVKGSGAPATWLVDEDKANEAIQGAQEQEQADVMAARMAQGAETAQMAAGAEKTMSQIPA